MTWFQSLGALLAVLIFVVVSFGEVHILPVGLSGLLLLLFNRPVRQAAPE